MLGTRMDGAGDWLMAQFEPWWFWALGPVLLTLGLVGLAPIRLESQLGSHGTIHVYARRVLLGVVAGLLTLGIGFGLMFYMRLGQPFAGELLAGYAARWVPFLAAALALGLIVRFGVHRFVGPRFSAWLRSLRIMQETEAPSDIREEIAAFQALEYRPSDHHRDGEVFLGLGMDGTPHYAELGAWRTTHKMAVGPTSSGKGIVFQILAEQAISRGETVVVVDPKGDRWIPRVLAQVAEAAGRRYLALDLYDQASPGTWSPFAGGGALDRRSRFFGIMDLQERGTDADHYKALARERLFGLFDEAGPSTTLAFLLERVAELSGHGEDDAKALATIRARLREWASYKKLNPPSAKRGFKVETTLQNNPVVYLRGALEDAVIRNATRALLMEIVQETRRLNGTVAHLGLFVDELRFLVSETVVDALATVRNFDCDITVAFQTLGDLESPIDTRLDGDALCAGVLANCQLKWFFGTNDYRTAEYVADSSGTQLKKVARFERTEINRSGGEAWGRQRTLADLEEHRIPINRVLALPKGVPVLLRPGALAEIVAVAPVRVATPVRDAA